MDEKRRARYLYQYESDAKWIEKALEITDELVEDEKYRRDIQSYLGIVRTRLKNLHYRNHMTCEEKTADAVDRARPRDVLDMD